MSTFIKKCREEAGLTQAALADKMGVSVMSIQNWERGRTKIEMGRFSELAAVFNVPVENLIKEILIEEDQSRPDRWPDFLFEKETNDIINTLHLNLAQQELFGLLYIYDSEYLKKTWIDFDTLHDDLKKIPYGFIDKVGSIRFMNQVDGLHRVIKHVKADFLLKVLKLNPEAEFNIRKLTKDQICEFIDNGHKRIDDSAYFSEGTFEGDEGLNFHISMRKARILLAVLEQNGPVHITDGKPYSIRDDIPEKVLSAILEMCDFSRGLWEKGYYGKNYNIFYVRNGLESVTECHNAAGKGEEEQWLWDINDKGRKLLEWFNEK